jgi:hypothetical protein
MLPACQPAQRAAPRALRSAPRVAPHTRARTPRNPARLRAPAVRAELSPEAARAAVDAALRGDAASLRAATGHYINAAANIGVPDVALFLLAVGAPPLALAVRFGRDALGAVGLTSVLMILPTLSLLTRPPPKDRADIAPLPLLSLMAAEAVALARCFIFTGH